MVIAGVPIFRFNKTECENEYLYHYTSLNTLYSILKNKELWLGNTVAMNDKNEIKEFFKSLETWLLRRMPDKEEAIKALLKDSTSNIEEKYPFAISFSTLEDDAAQWERYADNARGVCIKFNIDNLAKLLVDFPMAIDKVYYGANVSELTDNDQKMINEYIDSAEMQLLQDEKHNDLLNKSLILMLLATKYKNKGFSSECEYRMYTYKWYASNTDIDKLIKYDSRFIRSVSIDYNCIGNQIKKVLKIKLNEIDSPITLDDIIEKITIGPRSSQSIPVLKEFIKSLGYLKIQKKIEQSKCTLI